MKRRWTFSLKKSVRSGLGKLRLPLGKSLSHDNIYTPRSPYPRYNEGGPIRNGGFFVLASKPPVMTSSPAPYGGPSLLAKIDSQISLGESGISSKGSSMDESANANMPSSSAPSTPELVLRRKPPPKPPRLRSYYYVEGDEPSGVYLTPTPTARTRPERSVKSSLADVTNTLDASVATSPDGSVVMRQQQNPGLMKDKIYQTLVQTREFLLYEINPESIIRYLRDRGVFNSKTEQQLRRCSNKHAMSELLLDIITSKGQEEFKIFCDSLRTVANQKYIADVLSVLDLLIETVAANKRRREAECRSPTEHEASFEASANATGRSLSDSSSRSCAICICNNNTAEEALNDCDSFDIDIFYHDTETGNLKTIKDVSTIKIKRKQSASAHDHSFLAKLEQEHADRFIPVISLHMYNQCLFENGIETLTGILRDYTCVRELSLVKNHIDEEGMVLLGDTLQTNRGLVKLDIRLNTIGDRGAKHLAEGLKRNISLRELNVMSTDLSGSNGKTLLEGLAQNNFLTDLDIGFNDLQDEGCKGIVVVLAGNSNLRKLRMRDSNVTSRGSYIIFKALKKNSRLRMLDISSNKIGNDSLGMLAEMLLCNRSLKELNLEKCNISKEGCMALARALKTNTSLKSLDLSMNPIKDDGVEALSDGLKYNQVLDTLCLNMCNIGNVGFVKLLDALSYNTAMVTLKLCYNTIGPGEGAAGKGAGRPEEQITHIEDVYEKLCHILQFNKNLKVLLWGNKLDEPDNFKSNNQTEAS